MLNISFFITAFMSIFWLIFSLRYINLSAVLKVENLGLLYESVVIVLAPIACFWAIFAVIKTFLSAKKYNYYLNKTMDTLQKNIEITSNLSTVLLETEMEIKNSLMLKEFDTLIAHTNEILSDIIKRSNSISSAQMEHLWTRASGGERWIIAKTFIETHNFQPGFMTHLLLKAKKDPLLKGSIMEFQTQYLGLRNLLELHDKSKLFYNMVEFGALGRVQKLLEELTNELAQKEPQTTIKKAPREKDLRSPQAEEPLAFPSFFNPTPEPPVSYRKPDEKNIENGLDAIRQELLSAPAKAPDIKAKQKKEIPSIISLDEIEREINASPENNYDEYASPFGAWINDKKHK